MKLKFSLPLAQVALALALLLGDYSWQKAHRYWGASPYFSMLIGINAPVGLGRVFWFRYLPGWWDSGVLLIAIGLLWYWVALNVRSWRERKMVLCFSRLSLRLMADSVLVTLATALGFVFVANLRGNLPPTSFGWFWFSAYIACFLVWSLALVVFFGRDFVISIRSKYSVSSTHCGEPAESMKYGDQGSYLSALP